MAITNYDRIGNALELLRQGLKPYVEREMEASLGENWYARAASSLHRDTGWQEDAALLDVHALLVIMWDNWREVLGDTLGHAERSLVSELRDVRNR